MTLPDCMMPDGADPCKGFHEERERCERLRDALERSHKELLQYAWYYQGLTGLRERNERALKR